jgi:hypothetical protein
VTLSDVGAAKDVERVSGLFLSWAFAVPQKLKPRLHILLLLLHSADVRHRTSCQIEVFSSL